MMPMRKLEDLLKVKDNRSVHSAKQVTKPTTETRGPKQLQEVSAKGQGEALSKKRKRTRSQKVAPVDVSQELSSLKYPTKQNRNLPKLPRNVTVQKRPINHGPIASPFAGSDVPKVIYVSRRTPVISAVKRVKQFLRQIEKRAMQSAGIDNVLDRAASSKGGDTALQRRLAEVSERLGRDAEEVLVKASGRALEQALRIAEWFRSREDEMLCKVEVRTGNVSVIDDLVEVERTEETSGQEDEESGTQNDADGHKENQTNTTLEVGDTTMELLGHLEKQNQSSVSQAPKESTTDIPSGVQGNEETSEVKKKRRKRRKEYDADDVPEARLRWVKTVEVAISLRA